VVALAERGAVAVVGAIQSWDDGRTILDGDELLHFAVLTIKVTDQFKGEAPGGEVKVEFRRGGVIVDETGAEVPLERGARYDIRSVADLEKAAPVGTRVILIGAPIPTPEEIATEPGQRVVGLGSLAGKEEFAVRPLSQGFLLQDADGSYVSGVAEQEFVEADGWSTAARAGSSGFDVLVEQLADTYSR